MILKKYPFLNPENMFSSIIYQKKINQCNSKEKKKILKCLRNHDYVALHKQKFNHFTLLRLKCLSTKEKVLETLLEDFIQSINY